MSTSREMHTRIKHKKMSPNIKNIWRFINDHKLVLFIIFLILTGGLVYAFYRPRYPTDQQSSGKDKNSNAKLTTSMLQQNLARNVKSTQPALNYKGYPVKDITGLTTSCRSKSEGFTRGKACKIDNTIYFFKEIGFQGDDPLFSKYNLLFAENIGITVPNSEIVYEKTQTFPFEKLFCN